jgi:hypothetical protein
MAAPQCQDREQRGLRGKICLHDSPGQETDLDFSLELDVS